jgi:hypothetical protein
LFKIFVNAILGIRQQELMPNVDHAKMRAYNKMHASFRVQVEWGISGLKRKWRCLMKRFDSIKPKYAQSFRVATLLTNFLHKRHMDLTYEVVGDLTTNIVARG